ncbi:oxidoreductase, short-chain dehydrogenase reductase family [Paramyrothecium foliicola]|nr:oxidoreductase, short-chain dehydrogenase reductase family [Paramyrothecium foliicola]
MAPFSGFDPADIPDLTDKVILVTGGTGGIGRTTVLELARHNPGHVYFTGRNAAAAESLIGACAAEASLPASRLTFVPCDHASLESVGAAAARFAHDRLDVFVANAGVHTSDAATTADGLEVHFGVNHVGNAALLLRLLPVMLRTAAATGDARFVSVASFAYVVAPWGGIQFDSLRTPQAGMLHGTWGRYGQSKLANILFARALARRCPQLTSVALHPGIIRTSMVDNMGALSRFWLWAGNNGFITEEQGSYNTLWAATAPDVKQKMEDSRAAYVWPVGKMANGTPRARDDELADKLWAWTEEVVGITAETATAAESH